MAVLPDFLSIAEVGNIVLPAGIRLGSQDICADDRGSFTGEVSGTDLADLGSSVAEIGHVERKLLFHEEPALIRRKVDAAWRNGLTPLLCVGEKERAGTDMAVDICLNQIREAVGTDESSPLWVAYEPLWAIGARNPAPAEYVTAVCSRLKEAVAPHEDAAVLYGGSAGPGLLTQLWPSVDGLFLGRFAHKPEAFISVLEEALELSTIREPLTI
jgi:triosephosphate isomerase